MAEEVLNRNRDFYRPICRAIGGEELAEQAREREVE